MPHFIHETLPINSSVHAAGNRGVKKRKGGQKKEKERGGGGRDGQQNCIHSFEGELINT